MITFHCPSCETRLQVPEQMVDVVGPCPRCAASIRAPHTQPSVSDVTESMASEVAQGKSLPQRSQWMKVAFSLAFLCTAAVLVLITLNAGSMIGLWQEMPATETSTPLAETKQLDLITTPEETSLKVSEPSEIKPPITKPILPMEQPAAPTPAKTPAPPTSKPPEGEFPDLLPPPTGS